MISERLAHKSFVVKTYVDKAYWNSEKELYQSLKNVVKELDGYLDLETFNNNWNRAINDPNGCPPFNGKSFHEYYHTRDRD